MPEEVIVNSIAELGKSSGLTGLDCWGASGVPGSTSSFTGSPALVTTCPSSVTGLVPSATTVPCGVSVPSCVRGLGIAPVESNHTIPPITITTTTRIIMFFLFIFILEL